MNQKGAEMKSYEVKFNIGDQVHYINGNVINTSKVHKIRITDFKPTANEKSPLIEYLLEIGQIQNLIQYEWFEQSKLSKYRLELINKLL